MRLRRTGIAILIIIGSIYWILAAETGLQLMWRIGSFFIPGNIRVENLHGNVLHGISWSNLSYQNKDVFISTENAVFSWRPSQLITLFKYYDIQYANIEHIVINKNNSFHYLINRINLTTDKQQLHHITMNTSQGKLFGDYQFHLSPQINLYLNLSNIQYEKITLKNLTGFIHYNTNNQINSQLKLVGLTGYDVNIPQITIHSSGAAHQKQLNMQSTVDFGSIKPLFANNRHVQVLQGNLHGKVILSGTVEQPIVRAQLNLINGQLRLPEYNLVMSSLALFASNTSNHAAQLQGSFISGKGIGYISGNIKWINNNLFSTLQLRGNQLRVYNTAEYKIDASPHLQFDYQKNHITLSGTLHIPYASISSRADSAITTLPSDVVIVNRKQRAYESSLFDKINLSVQISLSKDINIAYENFRGKLTGNLHIIQHRGGNLTATGQLIAMNGKYRAYGRVLDIQNGRLIYINSPLTNPGLDIRAATTIRTAAYEGETHFGDGDFQPVYSSMETRTVGVIARGTMQKPIITLFSSPPGLSQGDILSYLLFGYPQSQLSSTSSLSLLNIASSMHGGNNPANLTQRIQSKLGADELGVGSTEYYNPALGSTQQTTTVNIGKHLAPNLSVHYSVGIFENISILNLRYQINKHLAIQSETSTLENGGDLLYQIQSRD